MEMLTCLASATLCLLPSLAFTWHKWQPSRVCSTVRIGLQVPCSGHYSQEVFSICRLSATRPTGQRELFQHFPELSALTVLESVKLLPQ